MLPDQGDVPVQAGKQPSYPEREQPLPIPFDQDTTRKAGQVIELSYIDYLKELNKEASKDNHVTLNQLHNILSEFLGPYILIGYLPDNDPIEMMSASSVMEKEAVFERLRKTFMRHMNHNQV